MANINDVGNTRSTFPTTVDTWSYYVNSEEEESVINAEIWNKIETAILRTQEYNQTAPRVVNSEPRKIVSKRSTVVVPAPVASQNVTITLSASETRFLKDPYITGSLVLVNARKIAGTEDYVRARWKPVPGSNPGFLITIQAFDPDNNISAGTYEVDLTVICP